MKQAKKIISLALCLCVILTAFSVCAYATQSNYQNFDISEVTLTDSPGKVMSAVAMAQLGKTGRELGYSEEWCADFVGDCAIIAGQSDAVPLYGGVEGLYTRLLENNASEITDSPEPGDLVFINWNKEERKAHIEIVYSYDAQTGTIFTVGGNTGSFDSYYDRRVGTHEIKEDSEVIKAILRPAYSFCTEHSFRLLTCSECGALRPEISSFINQLKAFIYNIKNLLDNLTKNIQTKKGM